MRAVGWFRSSVETVVLVAALGLLGRTWLVEGLVAPFEVAGGSMAETLLGPHRRIVCADCGWEYVCGADGPPVAAHAACPNCGYRDNDLAGQPVVAGDGLLIDKSAFVFRSPRRWEVVAFRSSDGTDRMVVKRVVGLPGETVEIRDGDVYVDGQLARKTLAEQRAMAVLVHDANYPPRRDAGVPPRWLPQGDSLWRYDQGVFRRPEQPGETSLDWLAYSHWVQMPGKVPMVVSKPITDYSAYNQSLPQRGAVLHSVGDVLLAFRVKTSGEGRFVLRARDGGEEFRFGWEVGSGRRRFQAFHGDRVLGLTGPVEVPASREEARVEVSLVDRQFLVAFDGRSRVAHRYDRKGPGGGSSPVAIGVQGLGVELRDLRLFRDVYYTRPMGFIARWGMDEPAMLGEGEFFVLGDNSLISEDSRVWRAGPGVSASQIVGRPFIVHFPSQSVNLGGVDFQVPAPARIRYIR